jgi:hypothetical protein
MLKTEQDSFEALLKKVLGDLIGDATTVESLQTISQTFVKIAPRFGFTPEFLPPMKAVEQLNREYIENQFFAFWSSLPLGLFDGKTPAEAAKDPQYKIRLLGALEAMKYWQSKTLDGSWDATNYLRSKLGLPTQDAIPVPDGTTEEEMLTMLDELPVWRWYRIEAEKLTTNALAEGLQIVSVLAEPKAITRFATEILNRPKEDMPPQVRHIAFELMILISRNANRLEDALQWIADAKEETKEGEMTFAALCLHEIPLRLLSGQGIEANKTIEYLVTRHGKDQRIMQSLQNIFVQLGLMNPDGTPSSRFEEAAAITEVSPAAKSSPAPAATKLWVPD